MSELKDRLNELVGFSKIYYQCCKASGGIEKIEELAIADSEVIQGYPDFAWGKAGTISIGWNQAYKKTYTYIRFPLINIDDFDTIKLQLYGLRYDAPHDEYPYQIQLYKVLSDWDEYTITWNNKPRITYVFNSSKQIAQKGIITVDLTNKINDFVRDDSIEMVITAGNDALIWYYSKLNNTLGPKLVGIKYHYK